MDKNKKMLILLIPVILLVVIIQAYYVIGVTQSNLDSQSDNSSANTYTEPIENYSSKSNKQETEEKISDISMQTQNENEPVFGSKEYFEKINNKNKNFNNINNQEYVDIANEISDKQDIENIENIENIKELESIENINENILNIAVAADVYGKKQNIDNNTDVIIDDVDMEHYIRTTQHRVKSNWNPPVNNKKVITRFKVNRNGKLLDSNITQSSGDKNSDSAAIEAIRKTSFMPLPAKYKNQSIDVIFTFDNNVMNASTNK